MQDAGDAEKAEEEEEEEEEEEVVVVVVVVVMMMVAATATTIVLKQENHLCSHVQHPHSSWSAAFSCVTSSATFTR